mgnify:CR=1 FL=1
MSKQDYYELLGVERGADAAALKKSYRQAAMKHHPDRNPGDSEAEQKFKEINEAYDVLKDSNKRAAYDQYGHAAFEHGGQRGQGRSSGGFDFSDVFEEFFGDIMGSGGRRQQGGRGGMQRGADIRFDLEVTLEEAFQGKTETIKVPTTESCKPCSGSGAEEGSEPEVCDSCGGHGKVRTTQGFFMVERTCPRCQGSGRVILKPCNTCRGAGRVHKEKSLSVKIPKGVDDGQRIRLSGEGEAGLKGGPSGDLYIFLKILPHEIFQRENEMLFCAIPIPMVHATLGGDIEVPTMDGKMARISVPAGTQTGRQFRLRGKGMPAVNSSHVGDMVIEVTVETPVNLTKRQKEILKDFAEEGGDKINPQSSGFFAKVKDLWEDLTE